MLLNDLHDHVVKCAAYATRHGGYTLEFGTGLRACVDTDTKEIKVPTVYTLQDKWLDQFQRFRWQSEVAAWRYARRTALVWTVEMEKVARECLAAYRQQLKPKSLTGRKVKW